MLRILGSLVPRSHAVLLAGALALLGACGDDDDTTAGGSGGKNGSSGSGADSGSGHARHDAGMHADSGTHGGSGAADASASDAATDAASASGAGDSVLDIAVCSADAKGFTLTIDNPYFPLKVGQVATFKGEEDGAQDEVVISVLDEIETVAGIDMRVVEERESEDGELVEISRNFFVQAADGTVCYFGEDSDSYENGKVSNHEGSWRAGKDGAKAGIIMPAKPAVGQSFDQEHAPGVALDHAVVTAIDATAKVPLASYDEVVKMTETSALEPGVTEYKQYAPGVGLITDPPTELTAFKK